MVQKITGQCFQQQCFQNLRESKRWPPEAKFGFRKSDLVSGKLNVASGMQANLAPGKLNLASGKLSFASGNLNFASKKLNVSAKRRILEENIVGIL